MTRTVSDNPKPANKPRSAPRTAARLAAVQALYQMDMTGTDANQVISEFLDHRLRDGNGDDGAEETDGPYFKDIVLGVVKTQREIDPVLSEHLAKGWHLSRIDSILRAILRSAAYEITKRTDVPAKVIINEYLDIAHAFFETEEPKVVNGILDALARAQRASEFKQEK